MDKPRIAIAASLFAVTFGLQCPPAIAQAPAADPSAAQIIDALKPARSRGLRNLDVNEVKAEAPAQAGAPTADTAPPVSASTDAASATSATAASIDLAIQFEFNSSRVTSAGHKTLDALAAALVSPELMPYRFRIEGHTDSKGRAAYNMKLSQARAEEVKRTLIAQHIATGRLVAEGKGASMPLNRDNPAAPENRRVRIVSLGQ